MAHYTNALIHETSPYLLQHAHNPVNWYPWGEEALILAKQEDKPILLSIGYSACHWCHVMAHESFEAETTAAIMNQYFINIKVDREERPDLDKVYQLSHQLLTQRPGGWPLTVFLEPEQRYPFFSGTYFPSEPRYGLPAFSALLRKIYEFYQENKYNLQEHFDSLATALAQSQQTPFVQTLSLEVTPLNSARQQLAEQFDEQHGGFSGAPKFPHLSGIERLLRHYVITAEQGEADQECLEMALFSLRKMALGGIYDQLGGGFCRYSVDDLWRIPHFEKMLYDNGAFLTIYSHAWQLTGDPFFKKIVSETADWVISEMQSPEGGFYSSLDADSEGREGAFYLWHPDAVKNLLDEEIYPLVAYHFGLDAAANFEGQWHLYVNHEDTEVAVQFQLPLAQIQTQLVQARKTLLKARATRIRPGRDEKILTSWNALTIKGLATAGRIFQQPDYLNAAERALDFIKKSMWVNGQLLATYKEGKAHLNAYLDDYAFLVDALLTLLQARWRDGDLSWAVELAKTLVSDFADFEQGGFYFTANHHEPLISRAKSFADESIPSGNGVAASVLGRLGHLIGNMEFLTAAEQTLKAAWLRVSSTAYAYPTVLLALEEYLLPPTLVILRGDPKVAREWQAVCQDGSQALRRQYFTIPIQTIDLVGTLAEKKSQGELVAYVCKGFQCSTPLTSLEIFKKTL